MAFTLRSIGAYGQIGYRSVDNIGLRIVNVYNDINMNGFRITNLGNPIDPQDAATKSYVDIRAAGLDPKESCTYVTVANIADFTNKAGVEAALDPVSAVAPVLVNDNRVLVKNQANPLLNGIYWWQDTELVRAPDQNGDPPENVSGGNYTFIEAGDTLANTGWVLEGTGILTLGVDPLIWDLYSALPFGNNVGAGTGLVFRDITNNQTFNFRTLAAGTDIGIVTAGNVVTISSTAATVTLSSVGGGQSIVNDGTGPALAVKSFTGTDAVTVTSSATEVNIDVNGLSSAGGSTLVNNANNMVLKGLTASNAVDLTAGGSSIDISVPGLSSAGGTTLVNNSNDMVLKGLTAGSGITLTPGANDITIAAGGVVNIIKATYEVAAASGIAIAGGVLTAVPLNTTSFSTGGLTRTGSTVVINNTSIYTISGTCCLDDGPAELQLRVYLNGGVVAIQNSRDASPGSGSVIPIFHSGSFTAGDVLELFVITTDACRIGSDFAGGTNVYSSFTVQEL